MKTNWITSLLILNIIFINLIVGEKTDYSLSAQEEGWEYDDCKKGTAQSPIDINLHNVLFENAYNFYSEKIRYNNFTFKATIEATGDYIKIIDATDTLKDKTAFTITYNDSQTFDYYLDNIHFHVPSEHTFNGTYAAVEAHFVHKLKEGSLKRNVIVFAVCFYINDTDIEWITDLKLNDNSAKLVYSGGSTYEVTINSPREVLALAKGTVIKYAGGLTTPPCSETVNWFVLHTILPMTSETKKILELKTIREGSTDKGEYNIRLLQEWNKRVLTFGNMDLSMMMGDN